MLQDVIEIVRNSGGLEYTQSLARTHAQAAEKCLGDVPNSEFRAALHTMVDFAINRRT